MIDENNNFKDGAIFTVHIDSVLKKAIYEECDMQIQKIKNTGINPSHIDSHEHTHTIPVLEEVISKLLVKHNITRIRRAAVPSIRLMLLESRHPSVILDKSKAIKVPRRNIIYRRLRLFAVKYRCFAWNRKMTRHFSMSNYFYAFRHFAKYGRLLNLNGNGSTIELMCHPGQRTFDSETEILCKKELWLSKQIELINYRFL